ncbi:methylated-DNA--[protein]-cysteine S-methyltransferase [Neobacillus sp. SuZ13]|uniref:methylated-DNA--[protein]-cysteine S-methyltransferase n=1 Tax=Neobacillus sp. SuZ13 TaxID=3047875 RepID=UPI0024BFF818|nr:methylated-DNA--[protein]-cysteine S-methyltransferase [Neobacillus sp. SuZ13]WHY64842.1 methylated-DNA--[protein]-cysteine S-methyltransferase [Neobacillus sp. SuZ13]
MDRKIIYWSLFVHGPWEMYLAATTQGLCYVGSDHKGFEELRNWVQKKFPQHQLEQDDQRMHIYADQFAEYFQGIRTSFTFPMDFYGTPFQQSVWNALHEIPYGCTHTYSEIAEFLQKPKSVRAVASAIGANPILITVPCHRVIGKNGKLTGFRGGLEMKAKLLDLEKVPSNTKGLNTHAK